MPPRRTKPDIRFTPAARADVKKLSSRMDSDQAIDRILDDLERTINQLARFPEMGRLRPEFAPKLRSFSLGKYVVFYEPSDNGIEVRRVLHGAQNLRAIFRDSDDENDS